MYNGGGFIEKSPNNGTTSKSRTMPFYCDGRLLLIGITFDLKPFIEARKARLNNKENH